MPLKATDGVRCCTREDGPSHARSAGRSARPTRSQAKEAGEGAHLTCSGLLLATCASAAHLRVGEQGLVPYFIDGRRGDEKAVARIKP